MSITRPTPIAKQVNEILRRRIHDETYLAGGRLPSESELAREFDVSRATVRTVLAKLEAEGLILRKQGDGTYVNMRIRDVNTHLGGLWEFSRLIEKSGYKTTIEPLFVGRRGATEHEASALAILVGESVLALKRLFHADQQPVILASNVIPNKYLDQDTEKYNGSYNIRQFLETYSHQKIAYAISDVSATQLDGEIAKILAKEPGYPLLKIQITFYDTNNQPLVYGNSYYDDSVLRLRQVQAWG
jgi:GntR family transcriptional regulator